METLKKLFFKSPGLERALKSAQPLPIVSIIKAGGGSVSLYFTNRVVSQNIAGPSNQDMLIIIASIGFVSVVALLIYKDILESNAVKTRKQQIQPAFVDPTRKKEPFLIAP